jgi:hypothetical protein
MAALRSGDVTVRGSESFADHRDQLLTIEESRELLTGYCDRLGLPKTVIGKYGRQSIRLVGIGHSLLLSGRGAGSRGYRKLRPS